MDEVFKVAVVGAGPAGLSAAARAAELGLSHVLLEASPHLANTVGRFQKGKLVMAEPARLPLRSSVGFVAGSRESVLATWQQDLKRHRVNLRTGASVVSISGQRGNFKLGLASGQQLAAECVVLAIGLQGNIRKLGIPGEDLPGVLYQLNDPDDYRDQTMVVIGAGDAGIENALALARHNRVILLNRQDELTNCREANCNRLREAIAAGRIEARHATLATQIEAGAPSGYLLSVLVQSANGSERIACHHVLIRIGALPPRQTLEGFGVRFPSQEPTAVPQLSPRFESNLGGLYIIGALAGYPLIKQALNQGYEVIEHIVGNPVQATDQPQLQAKMERIAGLDAATDGLEQLQRSQPLFADLTTLQLRELLLDSEVLTPRCGEVIFRRNDYSNSFFSVLQGTVSIHITQRDKPQSTFTLPNGEFFGEMGLLSGRRRSGTAVAGDNCVLLETPRRAMLRLLDSNPAVQRRLDEVSLKRVIRNCYGAALTEQQLDHLVQAARWQRYAVGQTIFNEGDQPDALYMIRRGSVTVSRRIAGKERVAAYVSAGNYVGEMALVSKTPRSASVRAAAPTEMVLLDAARFDAVLAQNASVRGEIASCYLDRVRSNESAAAGAAEDFVQFLMDQGVGEATDVLLIDATQCIRCNNCEAACADVHDGTSRLSRAAGQSFELMHIPASCRHCEHPRCMKDCPPDAIHRSPNGEVFIDDSCIGCGNCQGNCPYGVIQMTSSAPPGSPGWLQRLLGWPSRTSRDASKPSAAPDEAITELRRKAVKCDMCRGILGGSACVRACPTGAAFRVSPEQFLALSGHARR